MRAGTTVWVCAAGLACAVALAGCGVRMPPPDHRLSVVAGFYPLAFAAERVGGDRVAVTTLTPPGAEPHDVELTPQQVAQIADADLVLYIRGFQPAVDAAVDQEAGDRAIDVRQGIPALPADTGVQIEGALPVREHDHDSADPHVWLDPHNMVTIAAAASERLSALDTGAGRTYRRNELRLARQLGALDRRWSAGTRTCDSRDLVVSHAAFGYLAARYGFTQVAISGLSPDAEPDPTTVAEMADFVRSSGTRTVYYETLVDPKIATTIANEAGVAVRVLDPIEGVPEGSDDDYFSLMAANLRSVREGQPCR